MKSAPFKRLRKARTNKNNLTRLRICIASINIEIECLYGNRLAKLEPYLTDFPTPEIVIRVSRKEIEQERQNHLELHPVDREKTDLRSMMPDSGSLESIAILRKLADGMIPHNTILMHGAVLEKDGNAYMFTAPSGTGKTTRVRLWKQEFPDSTIINGDKPLIRIGAECVYACGSPWCGKEGWNTNTVVPLRAIFLLSRADDDKTSSIEEISHHEAFPFLLQQTYRPDDPELMLKTIHLLEALDGRVKIYKFRSAPTQEAVRLAYETARPRQ